MSEPPAASPTPPSDHPYRAAPRAAFDHREFRLWTAARFVATIAAQVQSVAVGWQVYEMTRRPLDLGFVGLAQFASPFALSLFAGHAADRFDRRMIVAVTQAASALCSVALLALALSGSHRVGYIYAVLVLLGTARAFGQPAGQALLPHLVPVEQFANAVAWNSSVWQVATIVGPAFGGVLFAWKGAAGAYAFSLVLLALATGLVLALKTRTGRLETGQMSLEKLFAGVRYVWQRKVILGSISLDLFAVLLGGAVAMLPVYARDILHTGPWGLGILRSAPAAGAALTAVWLAFHPLKRRAGALMFLCVGIFGLATIVFGASTSFALSLAALFVVGASDMVSVVVRQTLVQLATPPEMRGRVSAVNLVFVGASNELGEFESGATAAWLGTVPSVIVGGVGTLLIVAVWIVLFPALARVDRLERGTVA